MDEAFKIELKALFTNEKSDDLKIDHLNKKRVTWVTSQDGDKISNKPLRTTPFHTRTKKKQYGPPITLSFDDESDLGPVYRESNVHNISNQLSSSDNECKVPKKKIKHIRKKAKFSKNALSKSVIVKNTPTSNIWFETNISSPISSPELSIASDASSKNKMEAINRNKFDPDNKLARKILSKIEKANINRNEIDISDSEQSFEFTSPEADQIEIVEGDFENWSISEGSCSDLESWSDDASSSFKIPKIVKDAKYFKTCCQINEPNYVTKFSLPLESGEERSKKAQTKKNKLNVQPKINTKRKTETIQRKITSKKYDASIVSSFIEDGNIESDKDLLIDQKTNVMLSTQKRAKNNSNKSIQYYLTENYCIFVLKHPCKLYFHGKLCVSILSGAIEIMGHILEDHTKDIDVYSPNGSSYICLETIERKINKNLHSLLKHYISNAIMSYDNLTDEMCIIAFKNVENKLINCLEKYVVSPIFTKVENLNEKSLFSIAEKKLQCLFMSDPSDWSVYRTHEEWNSIVDNIRLDANSERSCTLICGGKGVGKSTFVRFIINKLLNNDEKVVCIDLDPGQPEFTIAGCVSVTIVDEPLLGPNYTHLKKPERCHFIGGVNITHCFDHYLEAVVELMTYCNENIDKSIPWIVNYMGFTRSLGVDLVTSVIKYINPTLVVQIQSNNNKLNFSSELNTDFIKKQIKSLPISVPRNPLSYEVRVIQSVTNSISKKWDFEPRFLRDMSIISYFSQMLQTGHEVISTVSPFVCKLSTIKLSHVNNTTENLPAILNGNLVALCEDTNLKCVGFGIVRGIDVTTDKLYLITPVQANTLQDVNLIVMGHVTLPTNIYMITGQNDGLIPYVSVGDSQKPTTFIPQRCYMPCRFIFAKK